MKEFIKKNKFNICVMFIYAIVTLIAVIFHENWRDEAQSWLIARDLSFIDIFKQMKYEGHPCLWHYIIAPFAKLGFPYITQNIISWIIMNITAFLLLKKSPFDNFIKILILFSSPFIYFYSAISRSYCLIPLAIVLIAITYKNRKEKPIQYVLSITFLAHTHILMLGLVGILYLFFFFEELILKFRNKTKKEKKLLVISLIIAILGLALLFIQLFNSLNSNVYVNASIETKQDIYVIILSIISNILGRTNLILLTFVMIITIYVFIINFIMHFKTTLITFLAVLYQLFVFIFIYSDVAPQKACTILILLIFWSWIQKYEKVENIEKLKKLNNIIDIYLVIILSFTCLTGIKSIITEIKYNYSCAKQTANFINNNISDKSIFIASKIQFTSAIIPYTNNMYFWNPKSNDYYTFVTWNNDIISSYSINELEEKINNNFVNKDNIYFIYSYNWSEDLLEYFLNITNATEIFRSEVNPIRTDEKYIIYKLYDI